MLIAIDGNEANVPQRVGVNQVAFELLNHLAKLETEHQFVVFLKDRPLPDLPPTTNNFSYEVFGPRKAWVLTGLTLRLLKSPRPRILLSPSHYIPLLSPVPRVPMIMDLSYEKFGLEYFKNYDLQQLRRWTSLSIKKAKKIITISDFTKNDIVEYYHAKPEKIEVVYPGYNQELFHPRIPLTKQKQIRKKYKITGKYFVYVGTLQPRKNIKLLIKAFSKLGGGTKLVIVGKKGWLYDDIFALVKKLEIENKVIFTGFVPGEDLPSLYKASIAYVLPSLYEGFGIPVIEAQACGAITIVSKVSSLPEIAGVGTIYIENPSSVHQIAEALREALSLPKVRRAVLIKQNKENALRFSWEKAAQQTLNILIDSVNPKKAD